MALGLGAMVLTGWGLGKLEALRSGIVVAVAEAQRLRATGRAAYLTGAIPTSPAELLSHFPIRLVYFFFSPFPWMVSGLSDLLGLLDAGLILLLFVAGLRGSRGKRSALVPLWLVFLVVSTAFSLGTSNYGSALRHRGKLIPLLIVPAALSRGSKEVDYESA